jgi:hypothetical protein
MAAVFLTYYPGVFGKFKCLIIDNLQENDAPDHA